MADSESTKESAGPVTIDEEFINKSTEGNPTSDNIGIDKKRRHSIIPLSHQPRQDEAKKVSGYDLNNTDELDSFIFNNFKPFSGSEEVTDWLVNTDKKFNLHKISRDLRHLAIPLLIEGDAKIRYLRNRNNIKSFDDFLEFLLTTYDVPGHNTRHFQSNPSSYSSNQNNFAHNSIIHKTISFEDQQKTTTNNFDLTDNLPPCPILRSTTIVDMSATRLTGEVTENRSSIPPPSNISYHTSNLDQTSSTPTVASNSLLQPPVLLEGSSSWSERDVHLFSSISITFIHTQQFIHQPNTSSASLLQLPVLLKGNSFESERAISNNLHYSYNQPQSNPHQLFLNRSEETGRNHLVEGTEDVKQWLDGGEQHSNQLGNQSSSRSSQDNRSHYYANNVTSTNITILFDSKPPYLFSKY
ncbi:unnamed protein product [Rotaria sp. Silwood2]|nr:unnamed protein product [Rotaria sp. Silwood2]CAF3077703.1 unnamed protein product [Rotaria sp. Silwood2]CAF4614415.1 unnamed protein product [Rotaria sp. Silwood2]